MKKIGRLAAIVGLLFAPISSHTQKIEVPKQIKVEEPKVQKLEIETIVEEYANLELNCINNDLKHLSEAYNKNDLNALKDFGNGLIYESFSPKRFNSFFENEETQELRDRVFFYLFDYLAIQLDSVSDKMADIKDNFEGKHKAFEDVFDIFVNFYHSNKNILNKEYKQFKQNPSQHYTRIFSFLSDTVKRMKDDKKSEASLKLLEILDKHLSCQTILTDSATKHYVEAYETIDKNIADKQIFESNSDFHEKITKSILDFYSDKQKFVSDGNPFIDVAFKSARLTNSSTVKKETYLLLKEMLLSKRYAGFFPPDKTPYIFYSSVRVHSDIFDKTLALLKETDLNDAAEISDLEETITGHLRSWLDYFPQVESQQMRGYMKTELSRIILNNSYKFINLTGPQTTKTIFTKTLNKHFSNFIKYKFLRGSIMTKLELNDLFDNVKKSGNVDVLNSLIEPIKQTLTQKNDLVSFKQYFLLMGMLNTEESAGSFFDALNSKRSLNGEEVSFMNRLYEDELEEAIHYFDYKLLVKYVGKYQNPVGDKFIENELEKKIKNAINNDVSSLRNIAESSLDSGNLFFLKYYTSHWSSLNEEIAQKTIEVLKQNYLPAKPLLYLEGTTHLPADKAVQQIEELYNAGSSDEDNQLTRTYANINQVLGEEGYFVLLKRMIDGLKEVNTADAIEVIKKISEAKDEDSEVREYARKASN